MIDSSVPQIEGSVCLRAAGTFVPTHACASTHTCMHARTHVLATTHACALGRMRTCRAHADVHTHRHVGICMSPRAARSVRPVDVAHMVMACIVRAYIAIVNIVISQYRCGKYRHDPYSYGLYSYSEHILWPI